MNTWAVKRPSKMLKRSSPLLASALIMFTPCRLPVEGAIARWPRGA